MDRDSYYLNIHTAQHPAGAMRGQLDTGALVVPLTADAVTDGGEEDATGTTYLQVSFVAGLVCLYTVTDATPPFVGYHLHEGERGVDGPVVVEFEPPDDATGEVSECLELEEAQIAIDIETHYLQIHTEDHPDGAVRGDDRRDPRDLSPPRRPPPLTGARGGRRYAARDAGARRGLDRFHQPR
jgi:hypothetical protein